jgi:hypothetical protein
VVLVNGWYILGEEVKALKTILRVIVERTALGREWLRCLNPHFLKLYSIREVTKGDEVIVP